MTTLTLNWDMFKPNFSGGDTNDAYEIIRDLLDVGFRKQAYPSTRRTILYDVDTDMLPIADLLLLLSTGSTYNKYVQTESYPAWLELDVTILNDDVPDYLEAAQVDDRNRRWNEMPGYQEVDGRHFCAASKPIGGTNSGSTYYEGTVILKLSQETGVTPINSGDIPQITE